MKNITNKPDFAKRMLSFGQVPCYQYDRSLKDELKQEMTAEDAIFLYRQMQYIRAFESVIIKLRSGELVPFEGYKFSGATHLSIGQEGVAAGANAALRPDDYITSSHRGHGHSIAKEAYALRGMNDQQLKEFTTGVSFKSSKKDLLELINRQGGCPGVGFIHHKRQSVIGHGNLNEFNPGVVAEFEFFGLNWTGRIRNVCFIRRKALETTTGTRNAYRHTNIGRLFRKGLC